MSWLTNISLQIVAKCTLLPPHKIYIYFLIFMYSRQKLFKIFDSSVETLEFLFQKDLIVKCRKCKICNKTMNLKRSKTIDNYRWKCSGKKCNKASISLKKNSFFANFKIPIKFVVLLVYEFVKKNIL